MLDAEPVDELRDDAVVDVDEDIEAVALDEAVIETDRLSTLDGELVALDDDVRVTGPVALIETDTNAVLDTVEVIFGLSDIDSDEVTDAVGVVEDVVEAHVVKVPSARDADDVGDPEAMALDDDVVETLPVLLGDFVQGALKVNVDDSDG